MEIVAAPKLMAGRMIVPIPPERLAEARRLCGGAMRVVAVGEIRRPKTSAENRMLHALIASLAMYKCVSPDLMKRYVKVRAAATRGYPAEARIIDGEEIYEPKSVARATTVEVALLIDICYELALDWGVQLDQREEW